MDFGLGIGFVIWVVYSIWGQSLCEYMCVDRLVVMLVLVEKLLKGGLEFGEFYILGVFFRQFLFVLFKVQFDVVVLVFFLSELFSKVDCIEVV